MAKRLFYTLLWGAAAFSLGPAPALSFNAGPRLPFVTSRSAVRIMRKYGPPTKAERIWASPSDFDSVGPSIDSGHSPPSARDPKTFYASKLDAIQDEITKKEAESRGISAKLRDAMSALKFEKSYLGITDMEKLSQVVEGLKKDDEYNSNEIYWLRDTEIILLDRYQGLSSADFISKHLLEFAQGLTNATRTGNLLQLPDGVFFLGDPSLGSKMFVRPCYSELADLIVEKFDNGGDRRMILIGNRGIGKSMFTLFLLYCLRLDGKTVVLDWKNRWYRFSDDKGVERGRYGTFQSAGYLDEENGWFLSYPSSRPNQNFLGAAVVMASPNVKETYYDVWKYLGANEIFMTPWTLSELEQCREVLFPHVPKENVRESYNTVGGLPQAAFNRTVMLHLKSEIERRAAKVTSQDFKCLREIAWRADTWERDGDVLYHICLRGGKYRRPTLCLASEYARSLLDEDPELVANAE